MLKSSALIGRARIAAPISIGSARRVMIAAGLLAAVITVSTLAYVAIEGAQQPGWGGYDYSLLTKVLDAIEPYNIGGNVELIRSLNPKMVILTTASTQGPQEKHRVWRELLHGSRGPILWDSKSEFVQPDGSDQYPDSLRQ